MRALGLGLSSPGRATTNAGRGCHAVMQLPETYTGNIEGNCFYTLHGAAVVVVIRDGNIPALCCPVNNNV